MDAINRALAGFAGDPKRFRILSKQFGITIQSLRRHEQGHLTDGLKRSIVKHAELITETRDLDVMAALGRAAQKLERFLAAADAWLRDPNDPNAYNLNPRDHEVIVVWEREEARPDGNGTRTIRKKERLTEILRRCGELSDTAPALSEITFVEANHGNPRKLLLDAMAAGKPLFELIGKATGQIRPDPAVALNVFLETKEWQRLEASLLDALRPYPAALEAAGQALATIAEGTDAR